MSYIVQVNSAPSAAVPGRSSLAGGVHQNVAHHLRTDREEVRPAFQIHTPNVDQFQVNLMNQGRRLQDWLVAFPLHEVYGQAVEFRVDSRSQHL